jgi:LPS export ABC transporter protein LptC
MMARKELPTCTHALTRRWAHARIIGACVALAVAATMGACKPKAAPIVTKKLVLPDSAEQVVFGFDVFLTTNGINKGRLLSDTAFMYSEGNGKRAELRRVNATFYTALGADDGAMSSRAGTYNERLSRLEGRGNVIVTRKDGSRLTSPQLVYDNARNQIFSDSSFVLNQPARQLTGIGFDSDPKFTTFHCHMGCKVTAPVRVPK